MTINIVYSPTFSEYTLEKNLGWGILTVVSKDLEKIKTRALQEFGITNNPEMATFQIVEV